MASLIDAIYEAAFVPEFWPDVLARLAVASHARSGAMLIIDESLPPLFSGTPNNIEVLSQISQSPFWYENPPARRMRKLNYPGFMECSNFIPEEERTADNAHIASMAKLGVDWQVGSVVDMPDGEMVLFTFERASGLPDFDQKDLAVLDGFRPHLARAGLMAMRLQLERARASVSALNVIGVPAGIVSQSGTVVATNGLFEDLGEVLRPAAFGRLAARDREADRLLQAVLPQPGQTPVLETRSIPMHLNGQERSAIVVHVIPLVRAASDIFDRGSALVAVTGYSVTDNVPPDAVLRGLFDLTAAEARLASALAAGQTLNEAALSRGISAATARTHLAKIFAKTGTRQQSELVALLKGSHVLEGPA